MSNYDDDRLSIVSNMYVKTGDDTTILDSSTVPTYEEFTRKKINKNLFNKLINLNSTQYNEPSSLMTDDESDDENEKKFKQLLLRKPLNNINTADKLCSTFNKIQIQSHSPNINPNRLKSKIEKVPKIPEINESEEYIQLEHKQVQTSFTSYDNIIENDSKSASNENLNLYLSKSVVSNNNEELTTSNVDVVSETIIESPQSTEKTSNNNFPIKTMLLTTPLRLTESSSICPKSFIKLNDDQSPKLIRLSPKSPKILTTFEKVKINEKNVIIINNQLEKKPENKSNKSRKRISMCAEDLPQEIVEHNLDVDENRLDVTRGNIVTLESINENDKENQEDSVTFEEKKESKNQNNVIKEKKGLSKVSSDSESNDEAYEKFLQQYRQNKKNAENETNKRNDKKILKEFIVHDDYESTNSISEETNEDEKITTTTTSSSEEIEQIFYIKTNKKISNRNNKIIDEKPGFNTPRTINRNNISTTSSDEEDSSHSESESDEPSIQLITPVKSKIPIRSKNSESALESVFRTPQPKINSNIPHFQFKTEIKKISIRETVKRLGFIESLSSCLNDEQRHPEAIDYCRKFSTKKIKDDLLQKVFHIFNQAVFDGKLPTDMKLMWNNRLTSTAGMCKYKTVNGKPTAEIHISTKVCDSAERLRDTCVHEMCHSAVYLFHGSKKEGHGRLWQNWAYKVTEVFKNIPKVTTSHNYAITKKFIYKCLDCGQEIHRFQKSIDLDKNLCGRCHGRFVLLYNDKKQKDKQINAINDKLIFGTTNENNAEIINELQTPRKLNTFAQFVKDNYNSVKIEKNLNTHKDVMQEISKKFKLLSSK